MKLLLRLSLMAAAFIFFTNASFALIDPTPVFNNPANQSKEPAKPSPFAGMTVQDFLSLTPKKYKELTGKRMSFSQKISLKISQYKVKKMAKKNKYVDLYKITHGVDTTDFSIGGFVIGLLLGPIGVLVGYIIGDRSFIKWAWIGFLIWVGFVLLVLIL